MYRTNDPRFRRRLNELGQTLESANETAQSSIYIFGQNYIRPCLDSVGSCLTTCVDASCPSLNLTQRDRIRRQRGRGRSTGRAESSFDFYDDWDEDENDGLLGWGNDEFDRLVGAGNGTDNNNTSGLGYGTLGASAQPGRTGGMAYQPKVSKRKGTLLPGEMGAEPPIIAKPTFFGRLFGGKSLRYKPSAADLQEHPGTLRLGRNITEGEALLEDLEDDDARGTGRRRARLRSGTTGSADTRDSYSSRGDLFPSDEELEDDAIPLDDEFAMVLERRILGSGADTENSSGRSHSDGQNPYYSRGGRVRGKRTSSNRSRASTRRTLSSRSSMSGRIGSGSRVASGASLAEILPGQQTQDYLQSGTISPEQTFSPEAEVPSLSDLKLEERALEREEEADVERRRNEAHVLALKRGLASAAAAAAATAAGSSGPAHDEFIGDETKDGVSRPDDSISESEKETLPPRSVDAAVAEDQQAATTTTTDATSDASKDVGGPSQDYTGTAKTNEIDGKPL
jgi:hypothetical protein